MRRRREGNVLLSAERGGEEGATGTKKGAAFYVVEADAWELPEFHERERELCGQNLSASTPFSGGYMGSDWYGGCSSWAEATKLIREGWPEGVARVKALADKVIERIPEPESARRRPSWGAEGFDLDRDRLFAGELETMWRTTRPVKLRAPRVVRIVANWSISAGHNAESIAWNGATLTALADVLERADYQTEISLAFPTEHYDRGMTMPIVRVKAPGDPVNVSSLAAVAGHAGIYRSFGFRMVQTAPFGIDSTLGRCVAVAPAWERAVKAQTVEPVDILLELATSERDAIDRLTKTLDKLFAPEPDDGGAE